MRLPLIAALVLAAALGVAQTASEKKLKQLEKSYVTAKASLAKKPKDKKVRDQFVTAGVKYGHESMVSPDLPPRLKYRQALRIYREVLKVDPKNEVAKKESDIIIQIYKQMGRPIPD
jgi:hypothetical protein